MRNYVLMCLFVSYVCYGIEALFLENLYNHDCREGDYFWNSCLECKCHNNHLGCSVCGGHCAGKNIESHCSVGIPTTAAPVTHSGACDKLKVFEAVALMQFVHNDQGKRCGDGRSHDNDALVMTLCSAPSSLKWIDGEHVWWNNKCSPSIKPFTPIYFHEGDNKDPAIILTCSATEIKVWQNHKCSPNIKPYTPIYFHEGNTEYPAILVSCTDTDIKILAPSKVSGRSRSMQME